MRKNSKIEELLVDSPGVLNYNPKNFFEVQPNRMSPLFINIKNTLTNVALRKTITEALLNNLPTNIDFVCGMESGGSYYASVIASTINKPLILYRKNDKKYAEKGNFVGTIPTKKDSVVIIDDVIVSGTTIQQAMNELKNSGCQVFINAIFSYGHEDLIEKKLSVRVNSIANINNFLTAAGDKKILTSNDLNFLREFISQQKKKFAITTTSH